MTKIKMSDVFELPVIDNGRNNLLTEHRDETELAILAINSYDDNQAEIAALTIDLRKSKEFNCGLADEVNGLKAQVELLKRAAELYHVGYKSSELDEANSIIIMSPRQCLASVKADAVKSFGRDIGLYDSEYDDQEYIEITRHSVSEYIDKIREAANEKSNNKN